MELRAAVIIHASPHPVCTVLGERFGQIGDCASPVTASTMSTEPCVGAARTCHTARFGPIQPSVITERLIAFDPQSMSLTYEAAAGMPNFVKRAINCWSVHERDEHSSLVLTHATLELSGPMRLLGPLLALGFRRDGSRVLEELRYHVELGQPHPRKLLASFRDAPAR